MTLNARDKSLPFPMCLHASIILPRFVPGGKRIESLIAVLAVFALPLYERHKVAILVNPVKKLAIGASFPTPRGRGKTVSREDDVMVSDA